MMIHDNGVFTELNKTETRKGHPGVESAVQRPSHSTATHKPPPPPPPVRRRSFSLFFPPFRVLPCAHTEQSANFSHVPIPAGSLGCSSVCVCGGGGGS